MITDVMTLGDSITYLADESPIMHLGCREIHMHDASCFVVTCTYTYAYTEQTYKNTYIDIKHTHIGTGGCSVQHAMEHNALSERKFQYSAKI